MKNKMGFQRLKSHRAIDMLELETAKRLHWFFDESRDAFLLADVATGQLLGVNKAATRLFRKTVDQLTKHCLRELVCEGNTERLGMGKVENEPAVVLDAEGNRISVEISADVLNIEEQPITYIIFRKTIAGRNITGRELNSLHLFNFAINSSSDIIVALDERLHYLFANRMYLNWHNCQKDEIEGRHLAEVVGDEVFASLEPFLRRCLAGESVQFETAHTYPNIGLRNMEASFFPLRDNDGAILGAVGLARDVTRMKDTEAALEFEVGFRKILGDVANDLIALDPADLDDGLVRALAAIGKHIEADRCHLMRYDFDKMTVSSTHEWCQKGIVSQQQMLQEVPMEPFRELIDQMCALHPIVIQNVAQVTNAKYREMLVKSGICAQILVPFILGGKCTGTVGFAYISKNKRLPANGVGLLEFASSTLASAVERQKVSKEKSILEEKLLQSQKMEAIGRLAGGVAHDFNNILTSITGYTDLLLLELPADHVSHAKAEFIMNSATRAAELTRQLLAFSRKQIISPKLVDINHIIENLQPMLIRIIGEDIELKIIPAQKLGNVLVDPSQLEQIVLNLTVNARDAMPNGGKLLFETTDVFIGDSYVSRHTGVSPGPYVQFTVSDTGIGMSADIQKRIFEPFFTTKEFGRGTGLGLATIHGIVEQSGGKIEVYSESGHGTTFKIYFPRVEGESDDDTFDASAYIGGNETILIVEDEEFVRDPTRTMLEYLGYTVLDAASGEEAIALVKCHSGTPIDLLLTDVIMPGINGRELFDLLQTCIPNLQVLFTSGYQQNVIAHRNILDEGIRFLSKPFTLRDLAIHVRGALESREEQ